MKNYYPDPGPGSKHKKITSLISVCDQEIKNLFTLFLLRSIYRPHPYIVLNKYFSNLFWQNYVRHHEKMKNVFSTDFSNFFSLRSI